MSNLSGSAELRVRQIVEEVRPLPERTIASLPPANQHRGVTFFVSNGAGNRLTATSNGTAWYYGDGTAV